MISSNANPKGPGPGAPGRRAGTAPRPAKGGPTASPRRPFRGVLIVVAPFLVACMIVQVGLRRKAADVDQAWNRLANDPIAFDQPMRNEPANASAVTLEELSSKLGIGLSPGWSGRPHVHAFTPPPLKEASDFLADDTVRSCPDRRWVYERHPDRTMTLTLGGRPPWAPDTGGALALQYHE